jgi:hypothetical protein
MIIDVMPLIPQRVTDKPHDVISLLPEQPVVCDVKTAVSTSSGENTDHREFLARLL